MRALARQIRDDALKTAGGSAPPLQSDVHSQQLCGTQTVAPLNAPGASLLLALARAPGQLMEHWQLIESLGLQVRLLARCWNALHDELRELDQQLTRLTKLAAPRLLGRFGVGPHSAATLLVTAGDNPTRLRNESALCLPRGVRELWSADRDFRRFAALQVVNRLVRGVCGRRPGG